MSLGLHRVRRTLIVILILYAAAAASIKAVELRAAELTKVSLIPQWEPQAQFAGYYVAHDKGFYEAQGLDVEILRGGPSRPSAEMLAKEKADFGTMFLSTGIEARANGTPLVNIAQIVRKSTFLLLARKSSGIFTPRDMEGKRMGMWGDELRLQPKAFIKKYGIHVKVVPQSYTVNLFLRGGVDIASAMLYNEYDTIINSGVDPSDLIVFNLADYGVNFPEDGIYCLEKTLTNDPLTCHKFVKASIQGWAYVFDHPKESLDIVMKYVNEANIATNRSHQKWMLEHMKDAIYPSGKGDNSGELSEAEYMNVARELEANGLISATPSYSDFFRDCAGTNK
jgi:NitT/TauT family transport system substrate-binding protein